MAAAVATAPAAGAAPDDGAEAGLALADRAAAVAPRASGPGRIAVEFAATWAQARDEPGTEETQRSALDLRWRGGVAGPWGLAAAARLDVPGPAHAAGGGRVIATLEELSLGADLGPDDRFDAGRINQRLGTGYGYNPTDYFRDGSVRAVTSIDPAALREHRMGVVMAQLQHRWDGGAWTAAWAPRMAHAPDADGVSADWGATNDRARWLLSFSPRWGADLQPQWLLHGSGRDGESPQLGLNLTRLFGAACVGHGEWSGGRRATLASRVKGEAPDPAFRASWVVGLGCTTASNLTVTAELQREGIAADAATWQALRAGPLPTYAAYRQAAARLQVPATRDAGFLMLRWVNAGVQRLDLSGFLRVARADRSRQLWLEARYHADATDVGLQCQVQSGASLTEFGALPQRRACQLFLKHFL